MRVGLAGYGGAGRGIHAPRILEAGLEITAVATSNPDRVAQVAADLPTAAIVPDLDALLARDDLDVIVLATPSGDHADQAPASIRLGMPVVIDKPLAVNARAAREVVDAAREAGVLLTVFQNRRYDPSFRTLQRVVADGQLGDLVRIELRWERWRPVALDRWRERATSDEGGGLLLDLQTHLIDMAVQVAGPINRVYASLASHTTVAEDDALLMCTHESGVVSQLSTTSLAGAPGPRMRVLGRRAAFVLNEFEREPNLYPDLADEEGCCGWLYRGEEREAVRSAGGEQADFYRAVGRAVLSGDAGELPVDPMDAVRTLEVIDAARESARTGDAVRVAPR